MSYTHGVMGVAVARWAALRATAPDGLEPRARYTRCVERLA